MKRFETIFAAALLSGITWAPLAAQARVNVDINVGPPAPRIVEVPRQRVGYVWAPGYYAWNGRRHVWHDGRYLHERRGYQWREDRWEQRGDRWHRSPGHWERG